jgi:hypothetical protein
MLLHHSRSALRCPNLSCSSAVCMQNEGASQHVTVAFLDSCQASQLSSLTDQKFLPGCLHIRAFRLILF